MTSSVPDVRKDWLSGAVGLPERLHRARVLTKLSQAAVAERLGVSRAAVSQWETGATKPEMDRLRAISQLYAIPLEWLVTGEEIFLERDLEEVRKQKAKDSIWHFENDAIPYRSWSEITEWADLSEEYRTMLEKGWGLHPFQFNVDSRYNRSFKPVDCFASDIGDDSMAPTFQTRDVVMFWGLFGTEPFPGSDVLAVPTPGARPVLRRFRPIRIDQEGRWQECELVPENPNWPIIHCTSPELVTFVAIPIELHRMLPGRGSVSIGEWKV
ncbi:helix-turn-helix domain-containing protein [Geminicoccus sp.]|uniref:helix-turn-helix domain-containing protein n=1 Tax=Geminicoccus sp. TaxID=2024832 RepID=UPI0039C8B155